MNHNGDRDHRVAVLVLDGAKALDVGIAAHVFAKRPSMPYEVRVCGVQPGTAEGWNGLAYAVGHGLEELAWADTVLVPGYRNPADRTTPPAAIDALRAAHKRGARIAAISTGAFTLANAGLLDGHTATTHWDYTHVLRDRYPEVNVDENVLFAEGLVPPLSVRTTEERTDEGSALDVAQIACGSCTSKTLFVLLSEAITAG
ncbi:DJ-1/PfpI family protein [Plantibacter sp. VKM Ac-2885]|uniref:DJ-1/PfpI family protein n=1 Tax=Plantibacter sp. VKM Ac-2885 TaxID=2783828 RepID=UPI00351C7EA2